MRRGSRLLDMHSLSSSMHQGYSPCYTQFCVRQQRCRLQSASHLQLVLPNPSPRPLQRPSCSHSSFAIDADAASLCLLAHCVLGPQQLAHHAGLLGHANQYMLLLIVNTTSL